MKLKVQKRLAAEILKCSKKRIWFDPDSLKDIKEAITKSDIKGMINAGAIKKYHKKGVSRVRARKRHVQRSKSRRRGHGKRKGTQKTRTGSKTLWVNRIRKQRRFIKELKDNGVLAANVHRTLYMKAKGGFFRSKRHIKIYIAEHKLNKEMKKVAENGQEQGN